MSDEAKLKPCPCPFCGSSPKIWSRAMLDNSNEYMAAVKCDCGVVGTHFGHPDRNAAQNAAIATWNTRVKP